MNGGRSILPAFGLVDVHSHILPGMDDGARDVDEDTRCRKRVIVSVKQMVQGLGYDLGDDGGAYRQDDGPDDVVDPPLLKEMKNRLKQFHVEKTS